MSQSIIRHKIQQKHLAAIYNVVWSQNDQNLQSLEIILGAQNILEGVSPWSPPLATYVMLWTSTATLSGGEIQG